MEDNEESQGSQELVDLLASARPDAQIKESSKIDCAQSESDTKPQNYRLFGLAPGQPVNQTLNGDDPDSDCSQKENCRSSAKRPDSLYSSNDNVRSKNTASSQSTAAFPTFQSATTFNSRPHLAASLRGPFHSISPSGVPTLPSFPASRTTEKASELETMVLGNLGDRHGQSQESDKSDDNSQELEEQAQRQVTEYYVHNDTQTQEDSQLVPTQVVQTQEGSQLVPTQVVQTQEETQLVQTQVELTQSTQSADSDPPIPEEAIRRMNNLGIARQNYSRYMAAALEGEYVARVKDDPDFPLPPSSQLPGSSQASAQEVGSLLTGPDGEYEDDDRETPPIADDDSQERINRNMSKQFPAGIPEPGDELAETQLDLEQTQLATQPEVADYVSEAPVATRGPSEPPSAPLVEPVNITSSSTKLAPAPAPGPVSRLRPEPLTPANFSSPLSSPSVHEYASQNRLILDEDHSSRQSETPAMDVDTTTDDEDDIPLAQRAAKVKPVESLELTPLPSSTQPNEPKSLSNVKGKQRQMSAVNEQGTTPAASSSRRRTTPAHRATTKAESSSKSRAPKGKRQIEEAADCRRSTRSTRYQHSLAENDSEEAVVREKYTPTELDEEDYMTPAPSLAGQSSRKRKRAHTASVAASARKVLKTEFGSARRGASVDSVAALHTPFPVLALWTDGKWYPGEITHYTKPDKYKVQFYERSAVTARIGSLRVLELRVGDEVMIHKSNNKGTVEEVEENSVAVSIGEERVDVPYDKFCVLAAVVDAEWGDRMLNAQQLTNIEDDIGHPEIPASADNFLKHCGIILTTSFNDAPNQRDLYSEIAAPMVENGATLIADWTDALQIKGLFSSKSWKIRQEDATWFENPKTAGSLKRVFVVANDICSKSKYFIAVALGVPILHTTWLTDSFEDREAKDWFKYLLPKGKYNSPAGEIRLAASVDLDWGSEPEHLTNIMDNPAVPFKLFKGMTILAVGDYIPKPRQDDSNGIPSGVRKINRSNYASGEPLIMLAMGASAVTAVTQFEHRPKGEHFDYVVFKNKNSYPRMSLDETTYVYWDWVKQCLIAGTKLPLE